MFIKQLHAKYCPALTRRTKTVVVLPENINSDIITPSNLLDSPKVYMR